MTSDEKAPGYGHEDADKAPDDLPLPPPFPVLKRPRFPDPHFIPGYVVEDPDE